MSGNLITKEGYEQLNEKLYRMQSVDRREVIAEIARARESGNLDENHEYIHAQQAQEKLESNISNLVSFMENCQIVDVSSPSMGDRVEFGSTVTIRNLDTEAVAKWQLVGVTEFDIKEGKISYKSPIGLAMMGKRDGEDFEVITPRGEQYWEIEKIH
jgi:transcription elongation factor GreA